MKLRLIHVLILSLGIAISGFSQTSVPAGTVSGTWMLDHSPYLIQGDITIPDDSTLTIQAGVEVEFQGHYSLRVLGRLLAIGNEMDSIRFTVNDTTGFGDPSTSSGGWYGIRFLDTPVDNDSSKFNYCILEYGKAFGDVWHLNAGGAICILQFGKVLISDCLIKNNMAVSTSDHPPIGGGIYLYRSDVILRNNTFINNHAESGGAVYMDDSDPVFQNNLFERNMASYGGGVALGGESYPTFRADQFILNVAEMNGGGLLFYEPSLVRCQQVDFTGNEAMWGGGIGVLGGTLEASDCLFSENHASLWGGGAAGDFASVEISSSLFENNSSDWGSGGLHLDHAVGNIQQCDFNENTAVFGGAMHLASSDCSIRQCQFLGNQALNGTGGAIDYIADTSIFGRNLKLVLSKSSFIENSSSANSGAVRIEQSHTDSSMVDLEVDSCQFFRNQSDVYASLRIGNRIEGFQLSNSEFTGNTSKRWVAGPGIISESKGRVYNCVFYANYAAHSDSTGNAHGISLGSGAEVDLINCTIVDTSSAPGVGLSVRRGGKASLSNSIIWGCGDRPISIITQAELGSTVDVNYCTLENGIDSIYVSDTASQLNWGTGNLAVDPSFVDLISADLHLKDSSPCIGAGANSFMLNDRQIVAPSTDIEGNSRPNPQGSDADIGAYENELGFPVTTSYETAKIQGEQKLLSNFPNPFRDYTTFSYSLSGPCLVKLNIYNMYGQLVEIVVSGYQMAGSYRIQWDGSGLEGGAYLYTFETGSGINKTGKLLIIR